MKSIFLTAQDSGWYPQFLQPVADAIHADPSKRKVLDIGTGPGKLPEILIANHPYLDITAIDIAPRMIEQARKRLKGKPVKLQVQIPNTALPFADQTFDIVTFCSVLFLLADPIRENLMDEALRVLKPDGKVIILNPSGKKKRITAPFEIWKYPFSMANWTFLVWKTLTTGAARNWQKQNWAARYAHTHRLKHIFSLTFNNNGCIECITNATK